MQKRSLEISCYVVGLGAFGVFFRWLQDQLAFDEAGLAERSVFNLLVPLLLLGSAVLFVRFVNAAQEEKLYVPKDFCDALFNPGRLFAFFRWAIGLTMCAGGVMLLVTSETDKNVEMMRALSVLGVLSGLSFPLLLAEANYEEIEHLALARLYSVMPVALFSVWLVTSYIENAYNSVVWSYAIEVITICVAMMAFFRVAGFVYFVVDSRKCLINIMLGAVMCIMSVADERYMGMQLMLISAACMLLMYNWIFILNMKKKKPRPKDQDGAPSEDGFEHLS